MLAKRWTLVIVVAVLVGTGLPNVKLAAQATNSRADRLRRETDNAALQNLAPFKVFDNLYYVGVGYVGSWLITTNQGLILIDTLEGAYKEHPLEGIRKLGFDPANLKYVILTHYHLDHTAGAARIQELPGVRLAMGAADWDALAEVPNPNHERLPRRDIAINDGDTVTVGSTAIKLHVMGGHTPATLGVDFTVYDGGKPYRAFMKQWFVLSITLWFALIAIPGQASPNRNTRVITSSNNATANALLAFDATGALVQTISTGGRGGVSGNAGGIAAS